MTTTQAALASVLSGVTLLFVCACTAAHAQDFQKSYRLNPAGRIMIHNVSGNISIAGYGGDVVEVKAYKEGRDKDRISVKDTSTGNIIDLSANYKECRRSCNASIHFEVRVPSGTDFSFDQISNASGNIELHQIKGKIAAHTASGDIRMADVDGSIDASVASGNITITQVSGSASASTASGNIDATVTQIGGARDMSLSAVSGNVVVRILENLNTSVSLATVSGDIKTDFNLETRRSRYGPGANVNEQLGNGGSRITARTVSGDIDLRKIR